MKRCSRKVLIVDYSSPLPSNLAGTILHFVEFLAGKDHYGGFRSYQSQRGLDPLLDAAKLAIEEESSGLSGGVRIVTCGSK